MAKSKTPLGELGDKLKKFDKEFQEEVLQALKDDANYLGDEMVEGYDIYVNSHRGVSTEGHFSGIGRNDTIVPARKYVLPDGNGGYRVGLQGRNVAYYEFGTGSVGDGTYPDSVYLNNIGWVYGSGPYVLQGGTWKNRDNGSIPRWYKTMIGEGKRPPKFVISKNDTMWRHRGYMRRGLPAGAFIYDAIDNFESSLDDDRGTTTSNYKLNRRGIYGIVTAILNNKK